MIEIPVSKRKIKKNIFYRIFNRINREIEWILINNYFYKKRIKRKHPINVPGEVIWCDTKLINNIIFKIDDENAYEPLGLVEDGNWDKKFTQIKDMNIYKALYEFINKDQSLKNTNFYNPEITTKEEWEKSSIWEYISEYDFEKRSAYIKNLVNSIKLNGYKTQSELGKNPLYEIVVKIGRTGEIFFSDGIHRFCIASILGIEKIPVIVKTRHTEWVNLKNKLYSFALSQGKGTKDEGKLYHKIYHPDLQDIPYIYDNNDRLKAILSNIITKNGTVLDIGSNLGFFSNKLTILGYKCTAVEQNNQLVYFLKKFNQDNSINILHGNVLNMFENEKEYDVVLALNIFHHFLKTEDEYNKFLRILKNLKMKEMFFEPHNYNENQFKGSYMNMHNEQFIKLIIDNTNLTNYEKILDCKENRFLYHLWH